MEFFRHCPGCGRRFHVKLENKKMVHSESTTFRRTRAQVGRTNIKPSANAWAVIEGPPRTVQVKEFELHYKCKKCGLEWTEHQQKKYKEQ